MKIWYYVSMVLGFIAMVLKVSLSKAQRDAAVKKAKRSEAARKASENATEALIRGTTDENTTDNPRDYKF